MGRTGRGSRGIRNVNKGNTGFGCVRVRATTDWYSKFPCDVPSLPPSCSCNTHGRVQSMLDPFRLSLSLVFHVSYEPACVAHLRQRSDELTFVPIFYSLVLPFIVLWDVYYLTCTYSDRYYPRVPHARLYPRYLCRNQLNKNPEK